MNYTLNQLRIFLKITQTESITKAAEKLNLTQPAVSIQLKNFQGQFDIPLTEVIKKKLYITDFGKEIAVAAENILNEVQAINYRSSLYKGKLAGRLKLSVVSTGKYVIPYFLAPFLKEHEEVELIMDVTNRARVINSLEKNEVDFSFVSVIPEFLELNNLDLMDNKLVLVGNMDMKSVEKPFDPQILETIPLIYRETGSATRYAMETFIQKNSLEVKKKIELSSNEAVKQAVIAGIGYSIMPLIGIKNELINKQLQIIPLIGLPITSVWSVVWLSQKKLSPVSQAFLDYLRLEKDNLMKKNFT
jgi:DNA-binding transcriptional LysR family regulator